MNTSGMNSHLSESRINLFGVKPVKMVGWVNGKKVERVSVEGTGVGTWVGEDGVGTLKGLLDSHESELVSKKFELFA